MQPVDERNTYLHDIPLAEARARLQTALQQSGRADPLPAEPVALRRALGRVTAGPVWAKRSAPHYHAAAMDGYAVQAADTLDATETRPVRLQTATQAHPVNTGAPLPPSANAVIMIEHVQHLDDDTIEVVAPVAPWQHVRMLGEDMVATELILPGSHTLRPVDIGAAAGCGHHTLSVRRQPFVILIPTGSELVPAEADPEPGQIIEYNSLVLAAQIEQAGGTAHIAEIVPDAQDKLVAALEWALDQAPDLVLMLSGSSAGSHDFTAAVVQQAGELLVHGVAVRPGHPVIIGLAAETPVIGIPGYPVSAALTGELFVLPLIRQWLGLPPETPEKLAAKITRKLVSPTGDDDYVRVAVARVDSEYLAVPLSKGAGVISSLVRADGLAHIPRFSEGLNVGDPVDVALYRPRQQIETAILALGSHDPMLDLLAQHLNAAHNTRLVSGNLGSMGGLVALRRGEAHLAGCHLLDEETGEYNLRYVRQYLRRQPAQVITFAQREQGLIVPKGNPQRVQSIDDLPRLRYINRQRGAGTRLLLDYELAQRELEPSKIAGYDNEAYTHLAVAAAVATGVAQCGLGVRSAALALHLDFVPVGWERFDLVIPRKHLEHPGVQALLQILNSDSFQQELAAQPGYDTSHTGHVQYQHQPADQPTEE